eukprot:scaffold25225_cov54-Attheya_sp.AAC.1
MANRDNRIIILKPDPGMGLEDWVDTDFCGAWDWQYAMEDSTTARSRSGYAIRYCGCPITWRSKLQTEVALSTTEAEYVALSQSLREVLPIMRLLKEAKATNINVIHVKPIIRCTVFEDNSGAMELIVSVLACDTTEQIGDNFTKPTTKDVLECGIMGIRPLPHNPYFAKLKYFMRSPFAILGPYVLLRAPTYAKQYHGQWDSTNKKRDTKPHTMGVGPYITAPHRTTPFSHGDNTLERKATAVALDWSRCTI